MMNDMIDMQNKMPLELMFRDTFNSVAKQLHTTSVEKGFWFEGEKRDIAQLLLLIHCEVSEATEAERRDLMDDHIPEFSGLEAELADVIIRVMDIAQGKKLRVVEALLAKIEYNKTRPIKHGGKKF